MIWKAAGVVALAVAATACTREAPRPAATTAPGITATAAAPAATLPPPAAAPAAAPVAAPGAAAPAGGGTALAREDTKWSGVVAEVTEFRRKGSTLTAKVRFRNQGAAPADVEVLLPEVYVMDAAAGKKYSVLKDETGAFIAALHPGWKDRWYDRISPGEEMVLWVKLPAPPLEVKAVTFQVPGVPPFDDLAIQDS
jgi:hypothetical protein